MKEILIYGAGGHARVVIDIVEKGDRFKIAGLVDDTRSRTSSLMGYPIADDLRIFYDRGIKAGLIAVGDNWQRGKLAAAVLSKYKDFRFISAIHPSAIIGKDVTIGDGTVVMAGCTINVLVSINEHCIINTGTSVDHDCKIEDYASLAPGVTLGGNVRVGEYSAIGLGASVIQNIEIGPHVVIGAGSVVLKNVNSNCVACGNPCRIIRTRDIGSPYLK